jgi:hypothetical protein
MKRGRYVEPLGIEILREERPDWQISSNNLKDCPYITHMVDLALGLACTPDCSVFDPARQGTGVVNIKSVHEAKFKKEWLLSDGTVQVPPYVLLQLTQEAWLTSSEWAAVAVLVIGWGIDLYVADVPVRKALFGRIEKEAALFWDSVRNGTPPEFDLARDGNLIREEFLASPDCIVDVSGRNILPELAVEDARLREQIKDCESRRDEIKNTFLAAIISAKPGDVAGERKTVAMYNGEPIATVSRVHVKEKTVKAYDFARLTIKGRKENDAT